MDKFLEKYNFPKLDQEEIENLNRPITSTEIETVIKNLPASKRNFLFKLSRLKLSIMKPICRSGSKLELDMEQQTGSK